MLHRLTPLQLAGHNITDEFNDMLVVLQRKLLVLVGSEMAIAQAVANDVTTKRVTLLAERIDNRDFAPPTTKHMSDD